MRNLSVCIDLRSPCRIDRIFRGGRHRSRNDRKRREDTRLSEYTTPNRCCVGLRFMWARREVHLSTSLSVIRIRRRTNSMRASMTKDTAPSAITRPSSLAQPRALTRDLPSINGVRRGPRQGFRLPRERSSFMRVAFSRASAATSPFIGPAGATSLAPAQSAMRRPLSEPGYIDVLPHEADGSYGGDNGVFDTKLKPVIWALAKEFEHDHSFPQTPNTAGFSIGSATSSVGQSLVANF